MIKREITDRILFIGPSYQHAKGGISSVIKSYSEICETFLFIPTTNLGNALSKSFFLVRGVVLLIFYLLFRKIDIIHIQGASKISFWRASIFIYIAHIFNKKIIYHIHGGGFKTFSFQHHKAVNFIFSKCDVIGALSTKWKAFFEQEFHCKDVRIIPNIIDYPKENHSDRKDIPVQFLFLGKICDKKGIFDLIDIIDEKKDVFKGKMKLIIGGNGETDRLEKVIKEKKLDEMVQFVGWVSGEKKISLLNNSHIFILPSYIEAYPISILEAMSYHLPVIATNVGDIPEIIHNGEEGYLVEPGNKGQILDAILKALNSPALLIKLSDQGFEKCKKHLPNNVENELTELYSSLINISQ